MKNRAKVKIFETAPSGKTTIVRELLCDMHQCNTHSNTKCLTKKMQGEYVGEEDKND